MLLNQSAMLEMFFQALVASWLILLVNAEYKTACPDYNNYSVDRIAYRNYTICATKSSFCKITYNSTTDLVSECVNSCTTSISGSYPWTWCITSFSEEHQFTAVKGISTRLNNKCYTGNYTIAYNATSYTYSYSSGYGLGTWEACPNGKCQASIQYVFSPYSAKVIYGCASSSSCSTSSSLTQTGYYGSSCESASTSSGTRVVGSPSPSIYLGLSLAVLLSKLL